MQAHDQFLGIETVSKHFGSVVAVAEVDLALASGAFFSLLGPSGCGKTTLLRLLAGFEIPTRGEIFIDGAPMAAVPPHLRPTNKIRRSLRSPVHPKPRPRHRWTLLRSPHSRRS